MAIFSKTNSRQLFSVLPTQTFQLYAAQSPNRINAELAVQQIFRQVYNADIREFSQLLVTAERSQQIETVIGLRNAGQSNLFLESYLDAPIEQVIRQQQQLIIERNNFVELGNLVAVNSGTSRQLFIVLAFALAKAGVEWVCFTATTEVNRLLSKLGLSPVAICQARQQAVANGGSHWGSYYDNAPTVCFGNVMTAVATLKTQASVAAIYPLIQASVVTLASQIKEGFSQ